MIVLMIVLFLMGYVCIAMEHSLKVNKSATALVLCAVLWTLYIFHAQDMLPGSQEFEAFATTLTDGTLHDKVVAYVTQVQIIEHLGDVAETLFFLIGAMTIVELIDVHGGFTIITDRISTRDKRKLLWTIAFITFFMSSVLDNLTTSIVMIMLLRKLVADQHERWIYAGIIIIAANAGGAFSPIGDVTTIMLWVRGLVTTQGLIPNLIIPSLLAVIVPAFFASYLLQGTLPARADVVASATSDSALLPSQVITPSERTKILVFGIGALIFVPIFKAITNLPPFIGVLLGLGLLWVYTEILYHRKNGVPESAKARVSRVLSRIDFSTILFFLGILMAVAALQCAGILGSLATFLKNEVGNVYVINMIIGVLSSIVDNVPLVAGCMGMFDLASVSQAAADPSLQQFVVNGTFWMFLPFCAGVGGSLLIIGSAAGVVVMGLEKINFVWYFKHFTPLALSGYLAGCGWYVLQEMVLRPLLGI